MIRFRDAFLFQVTFSALGSNTLGRRNNPFATKKFLLLSGRTLDESTNSPTISVESVPGRPVVLEAASSVIFSDSCHRW